jgi:hypothetical protein
MLKKFEVFVTQNKPTLELWQRIAILDPRNVQTVAQVHLVCMLLVL